MQIADLWLRDIPQQFQHKPKIELLIRAFSRQLQEVEQAFLISRTKRIWIRHLEKTLIWLSEESLV